MSDSISAITEYTFENYEEENEISSITHWEGREVQHSTGENKFKKLVYKPIQDVSNVLCMSRVTYDVEVELEKNPEEKPVLSGSVKHHSETKDKNTQFETELRIDTKGKVSAKARLLKDF